MTLCRDDVLGRVTEHGAADAIASKWVDTAVIAVQKFIETYRDCKYLKYRGTDRWKLQRDACATDD